MAPLGTFAVGTCRSPELHSVSRKRLSTEMRRYSGRGSSVRICSNGMSTSRRRSRRRSAIGLSTVIELSPPLPAPKSNTLSVIVGMARGTIRARAVAVPPMTPALLRAAPARTLKPVAAEVGTSFAGWLPALSEWPQRLICSVSWR